MVDQGKDRDCEAPIEIERRKRKKTFIFLDGVELFSFCEM